jgi:hypothetical protein
MVRRYTRVVEDLAGRGGTSLLRWPEPARPDENDKPSPASPTVATDGAIGTAPKVSQHL